MCPLPGVSRSALVTNDTFYSSQCSKIQVGKQCGVNVKATFCRLGILDTIIFGNIQLSLYSTLTLALNFYVQMCYKFLYFCTFG